MRRQCKSIILPKPIRVWRHTPGLHVACEQIVGIIDFRTRQRGSTRSKLSRKIPWPRRAMMIARLAVSESSACCRTSITNTYSSPNRRPSSGCASLAQVRQLVRSPPNHSISLAASLRTRRSTLVRRAAFDYRALLSP